MAEPLKNVYNASFLKDFSKILKVNYSPFDEVQFMSEVMDKNWGNLELKARMRKITEQIGQQLPDSFEEAICILLNVNKVCQGFPYLVLPDFVELYGQRSEDWSIAINALEQFTSHSSSEFAVRPFIINNPNRMMEQMLIWTKHENEHVRRLASEGCRPSLPWGVALTMFKQDPSPIIPILDLLKRDNSLYVRKSVANNINDISKQHPNLVISLAKNWLGQSVHTDWIVRHGCRTLIKKANPEILELFGYANTSEQRPLIHSASIEVTPPIVEIGQATEITYRVVIKEGEAVRVRIEYGIYFIKANKKGSLKKFLLSDKTVAGGTLLEATRKHSWANLTTRKHYAGEHRIVLVLNGQHIAETRVNLIE